MVGLELMAQMVQRVSSQSGKQVPAHQGKRLAPIPEFGLPTSHRRDDIAQVLFLEVGDHGLSSMPRERDSEQCRCKPGNYPGTLHNSPRTVSSPDHILLNAVRDSFSASIPSRSTSDIVFTSSYVHQLSTCSSLCLETRDPRIPSAVAPYTPFRC